MGGPAVTSSGIETLEWLEFNESFNTALLPKMIESDVVGILWNGGIDGKLAVEVGAAVLLGKPIIVIAIGPRIPTMLFDISAEVVVAPDGNMDDPDFQRRLRAAMERER